MWLLNINPTSGGGKGRVIGERVSKFLNASEMEYSDISGTSLKVRLQIFVALWMAPTLPVSSLYLTVMTVTRSEQCRCGP